MRIAATFLEMPRPYWLGWPGTPDPRRVLSDLVRSRPELLPRLDESVRRVLVLKARANLLN